MINEVEVYPGLRQGLEALMNKEIDAFLYDEPILRYRLNNEDRYKELEVQPIKFDLQFYAFAFSDGHEALENTVSQKILEYTESLEWRLILAEYDLSQL